MTCLYRSCNVCGKSPCVELSGVSYAQCRTCYGKYVAEPEDKFADWSFRYVAIGSGDYERPDRHYVYATKKLAGGSIQLIGQGRDEESALADCKEVIRKAKV